MIFRELYEKGLDRRVNPAVSASDLSEATVITEIEEYVFTQEIIANLYNILTNIKVNQGSHVGIWINGYYGSGKSHFLKYTSYCLSSKYADRAFSRLIEATNDFLLKDKDALVLEQAGVSMSELKALKNWYVNKAKVEMIMFNIGDVHDANADQATTFTTIFWNQFNARRGFNSFNLAFAQCLEKALSDDGKFEEFKEYVKSQGYDYERSLTRFAAGSLDKALEMAKEVDDNLAIDVIREKIKNNDINVSVEAFAAEIKEYLESKEDENSRIMFFVDEVSQFIGEHNGLILQLQSLVELLYEVCNSKVWIACTAQQTLEEVVGKVGVIDPNDEVGKILGRFEVRASLQGTSPEYITQRRILDKNGTAEIELSSMFERVKENLDAQFVLPSTYQAYNSKEDFVAYYPFVPYQFQLIMKVLDSFVNMNYVDRQVKGNERSLLNITFSIAKETAECEVGEFISFDRFFGAMFQGSMQHLGQRAMDNARQALDFIKDDKEKQAFYRRVVYVLFMVCNLSEVDKQSFSATIDNLVTLLMTKVDANRAVIKEKVAQVLSYLMEKSVIRKIRTENGSEIYEFYTQEESKVAELIKHQPVDSNTYSEELYRIIFDHFGSPNTKETHITRSFNIGWTVDGRSYLSHNADVIVDFITTAQNDSPDQFAFGNATNHLVFFLCPKWNENTELRQNFLDYCRVQKFAQEPAISDERQKTRRMFQDRARDMYKNDIKPKLQQILNTCPVISGQNVLTATEVGTSKGQDRYKNVLACHLGKLYTLANLVNSPEIPKTQNELSAKILRPVEATLVETPLSRAEQKIRDYLDRQPHDVTVADVVRDFAKAPYGWSDLATIYMLNELVRRHLYAYNYNNNPNVTREDTARNIVREATKFTVEKARAISQDILNQFIEAWRHIFNVMNVPGSNDSTELYRNCKETDNSALNKLLQNYRALSKKLYLCRPCVEVIDEAIALMENWLMIHDHREFFETITNSREYAAILFDRCKSINTFANDQYDKYEEIVKFIDDNRDNFSFLPAGQQAAVDSIKDIKNDMEPWKNIPAYLKLKRSLSGQLQECKASLIEKIKANYNKVFDDLEEYAKSVNVSNDKFARRDSEILKKTNTNNFYALQANADTSSFYAEQMGKITAAIPNGGSAANNATKNRPRKVITLNTHTTKPMRTEADVDAYLQGLKAEIMRHIGGDDDIIIK